MINKLLLILLLFVLSGCGYKEAEIIVQKEVETVYILPPKESYEKINIPAPISREKYLSLNIKNREKELAIYIAKLISEIKNENMKKNEVLKYIQSYEKK